MGAHNRDVLSGGHCCQLQKTFPRKGPKSTWQMQIRTMQPVKDVEGRVKTSIAFPVLEVTDYVTFSF
jgi:hypothetical protein